MSPLNSGLLFVSEISEPKSAKFNKIRSPNEGGQYH